MRIFHETTAGRFWRLFMKTVSRKAVAALVVVAAFSPATARAQIFETTIDFGTVILGNSRTERAEVSILGFNQLVYDGPNVDAFEIAPSVDGFTMTLTITFRPIVNGPASATVWIVT